MRDYIPRAVSVMSEDQAEQLNPLVLAFIGDCVETLYVRTKLVFESPNKVNDLHRETAGHINATKQSKVVMGIMEYFNEMEMSIFKRARNSKVNTSAKNATIIDYKKASGYEAVIGFLYLTGQYERLNYILSKGEGI